MFSNPRIEIFLDKNKMQGPLNYILEYYSKILEQNVPENKGQVKFGNSLEIHIRKF